MEQVKPCNQNQRNEICEENSSIFPLISEMHICCNIRNVQYNISSFRI